MSKLNSLTSAQKRLLGKDIVSQIEAGFRNPNLSLTTNGKRFILESLSADKDVNSALTKRANEKIEESKSVS